MIPIIERGLRERSADTKRKATQIVGQMAGLTDSKDFIPYLARLMPLVHIVLVDPVPEARATAAKALGTLVEDPQTALDEVWKVSLCMCAWRDRYSRISRYLKAMAVLRWTVSPQFELSRIDFVNYLYKFR